MNDLNTTPYFLNYKIFDAYLYNNLSNRYGFLQSVGYLYYEEYP